jgi:hypothetical protein
MKPERKNEGSERRAPDDARLWELLGKSAVTPAPDDFLEKVLSRVETLDTRRHQPSLAERWEHFCLNLGYGLRLSAGFALVLVLVGALAWNFAVPRGGGVAAGKGKPGLESPVQPVSLNQPEADTYAYTGSDEEMQTILQLDDYLALADQQAWLEPSDVNFLQ